MNRLINLTLSIVLLIIVTANPELTFGCYSSPFYFGIDLQKAQMPVEGGFRTISRSFSGINAYGGIKINDYVAIEGGFSPNFVGNKSAMKSIVRDVHKVRNNDDKKQYVVYSFHNVTVVKKLNIKGAHLGLSFTYPLYSSHHGKLEALGGVGAHLLKGKAEYRINSEAGASTQKFAGTKVVPRALVGLQYVLDEQFGVRTYVGYSNTSRLVLCPKNSPNLGAGGVKFKNTTFMGAGLFLAL